MSRVGSQPIIIKEGVTVTLNQDKAKFRGSVLDIKGKLGELQVQVRPEIEVNISEGSVEVKPMESKKLGGSLAKKNHSFWGLYRTLIDNAIIGVAEGYSKELEIVGIGYKAELAGSQLRLSVGFNVPLIYEVPEGIKIEIDSQTKLKISGIDKQLVGETAAQIRRLKSPEPYKGKGIKYKDEKIKRKAGKTSA